MTIIKNLANLRKSVGINQRDMAEKLNMAKATYAHYESGRSEPSLETLIKIADYFGCSIDYLLGHETKDLIYVNELTDRQVKMIDEIKTMEDDDIAIIEGVLLRLKMERENPWTNGKPLPKRVD